MKFILKKLEKKKNRTATFVCNLSYIDNNDKIITVEGRVNGKISKEILGKKGFGYDPIFIPNNQDLTFGQITKLKKIKIDHRYFAFKKLKKKIRTL